ncbi:MAG: UPF0182 family protein [Syntrophomonadaceae bacterium]|jgi:uncharacterized membrane protein (UPF0182 family)|nr:UPF0182 family protein [Syntrophomonadaceae bacterium]
MEQRLNGSTVRLIVFIVLLGVLSLFAGLYAEWLWFDSVKYASVFTTIIFSKITLYVTLFIFGFLLFYINLRITRKNMGLTEKPEEEDEGREVIYLDQERPSPWRDFMQGPYTKWIFIGVSLFGGFILSSVAGDYWIVIQQYLNKVPVGTVDPVFSKDLGFYFFNLNFYQFIYSTIMTGLILVTITVGVIYALNASSDLIFGNWRQFTVAKSHIAILIAMIFALKAWGYVLDSYGVLFSPEGIVFGATYTDMYARLIAYKILMAISIIITLVIIANIFVKKFNLVIISIGIWLLVAIVMGGVYPTIIQNFIVQPNEFNKERPYIERAIEYTRAAYGLDSAENQQFDVDNQLDIYDPDHKITIDNIRLWDWQPLMTTYKNLQQLRPYYVFDDVDVDRYKIDGNYRQVMLSAREIDQAELPEQAKTWINQKLMYTHGYGLVVSPVTEVAEEGFPEFFIKDIPPRLSTDLNVERPEIYFGEVTDNYVIVNTLQKEFDYPMGEQNVYTTYEGDNGIKVNSIFRKLVFSWVLKDYKMMLSSQVTNDSQILMNRNIVDRVKMVTPYLSYDSDPYIVINEDGKLYWIMDGYTYTNKYPYSEPFDSNRNNYLRNSVKVTIDAYTGDMDFYIADKEDPIIKTYAAIFPDIFKPISQMPEGLKAHIRYPVDMFKIQANTYRTFHMTDPYVFYNKEDPWLIPTEVVDDKSQTMEPYYIIMKLPGEEEAEYILMLPFTPKSRPNMVGWMCARMDGDQYGKLLVYNFPKQETIYGPEQIESRINQNTLIAQQLSLWDQRGSRVYRGNLLVIPMGNSILYVEPMYLQADSSKLPELKRVIAGFGNKTVMEPTLEQALISLFGRADEEPEDGEPTPPDDSEVISPGSETVVELAKQAKQYYDQAEESLSSGDWAGYGNNLTKLKDILDQLQATVSEED